MDFLTVRKAELWKTEERPRYWTAIYFSSICDELPKYLLERINENGFSDGRHRFLASGKTVVGVSAGSIIFAENHKNNLGLLPRKLDVHCNRKRRKQNCKIIEISDKEAVVFRDRETFFVVGDMRRLPSPLTIILYHIVKGYKVPKKIYELKTESNF